VLDLFAGTGGLSLGFANQGYAVTGVDADPGSAEVFELNGIGRHIKIDLSVDWEAGTFPVVVGGPPCRPWSAVNLQKRGTAHEDYLLLRRFFDHVLAIRPQVFLMENVPPVKGDPLYLDLCRQCMNGGYTVESRLIRYSDFGASTARRRLFTFGYLESGLGYSASDFFAMLVDYHHPASTVRKAIGWVKDHSQYSVPDHDWSQIRTIGKYADRYASGQFGWTRLEWDRPAPSFGSVAKTYILHPDSDAAGTGARVVSVREVLSIMGFPVGFHFPKGMARHRRYRMAANAVSPLVSEACAKVITKMLQSINRS